MSGLFAIFTGLDALAGLSPRYAGNAALAISDLADIKIKRAAGEAITPEEEELWRKYTAASGTIDGVINWSTASQEAQIRAEARRKDAGLQQQQKDVIAIKEAEKRASKIKTVDATTVRVRLGGTEDTVEAKRRAGFKIKSAAPAISVASREVIKL